MIKVLHAADFHLDSAFSALPAHLASQRRSEQRDALIELAKKCENCDIVLLSGDLFDSALVYRDTIDALKECFASIRAQIFISPGNHDCLLAGSAYLSESWGENVHIFRKNMIERVHLEELGCDVYGAGYCSAEQAALLENFHVACEDVINLMVLHAELQPISPYCPITTQQIAQSGLDYLALGHIHTRMIKKVGATTYAYPGCLMGRGFDECGQKGVLRAQVCKGNAQVEFFPIRSRKYEVLTVDVGENALNAILRVLPSDCAGDCYRIFLCGESEPVDLEMLQEALEHRFFSLSLRDRTLPKKELWSAIGEDTLRGYFLRDLKEKYDNADEAEQHNIAQAARLVLALMDGREVAE